MQVSPPRVSPCGAEPGEVHEPGEREQRLVRRDVRGRLLAADVLLAGLQRQDIAAFARGVGRLADDPARQPARCSRPRRGEEAVVRAAVATGSCPRPAPRRSPSRSRSCPGASRHAERDRVDVRDRRARPASFAAAASSGAGSRQPKKFGCWKITQRGVRRPPPAGSSGSVDAAAVRHLDDLEPEAGRVGLDDLAHLRVQSPPRRRPSSGRSRASRRSRRRRRPSCRRSRRRSRRPSRSARRSPSGTRRSPGGRPGSSPAGTACTRSGTRRAGAPRRRPPGT